MSPGSAREVCLAAMAQPRQDTVGATVNAITPEPVGTNTLPRGAVGVAKGFPDPTSYLKIDLPDTASFACRTLQRSSDQTVRPDTIGGSKTDQTGPDRHGFCSRRNIDVVPVTDWRAS